MPIYEYVCQKCGKKFEELALSMINKTKIKCPDCGGDSARQVSTFAAHDNSGQTSCQLPDGSCGASGGSCCGGSCPFGGH
ncbi:MAG: zinc ribbon domain-containing protein [Sedimentisphaerales bacterium]|nr:zinc ribbon domain-containing protein [Sedimentisphaerales bacterium]